LGEEEDSVEDDIDYLIYDVQSAKKESVQRQEREVVSNLNLDFKPYLCAETMTTWGKRLRRIEQKLNVLHPELIALSIELHARALDMIH